MQTAGWQSLPRRNTLCFPPGTPPCSRPALCPRMSASSFRRRCPQPRRRGVRRQLEQLLLDVLTGPQGDAPQKGAVRVLFQPAAAGPAVADIESAVLVQRQCAGVSRQAGQSSAVLPPAVSSRASASTLQMQRFPRSETYSVRSSSERARPAAPATPPSTCSTVRADGSYT